MISAMTKPIAMMPSVEPTTERSSGGGVGVGCKKKAAEPKLACVEGGAEYVRAALNSARTSPSPIVMVGRINLLMSL